MARPRNKRDTELEKQQSDRIVANSNFERKNNAIKFLKIEAHMNLA
jgi:hypothetical protein